MPNPAADLHLRLDLLNGRASAVTATITGTPTHTVRALLALHGFEPLDDTTMVMARIDREEPHYADQTAHALRAEGVTVDITPRLREEINTEWTWANYPMPWCSRDEIREVSNDAQKIYDDIRSGRLVIHAHAHDGWTIVAVGTYRDGPSVHLHGENHLRVESLQFDAPAAAIAEFERLYGDAVRPGPAPATDTELEAEQARSPSAPESKAAVQPPTSTADSAEIHADGTDHETLLNDFLESHGTWEKWRTWFDDTTHAVHESLVLRVEFIHEADPGDTQWKIAAYESPVGERRWHAAATTTVPVEVMRVLLDSLDSTDAAEIAAGSKVAEATIWQATRPLFDAGWEHDVDGRFIRWQAPGDRPGGVQFDAFAANIQQSDLPVWTFWGVGNSDGPGWALHFSTHAAATVLQDVAFSLADRYAEPPVSTAWQGRLRSASPAPPPPAPGAARAR
ncbi:DUF317 domain-containing protein [Streptomyces sp. NPDC058534]|uniref:DUF317 domain-containing protein n=1 Tax=Streptomyces sp. NPDC058534 TaxID=3346541 RepID=UPI0036545CC8